MHTRRRDRVVERALLVLVLRGINRLLRLQSVSCEQAVKRRESYLPHPALRGIQKSLETHVDGYRSEPMAQMLLLSTEIQASCFVDNADVS